MILEIPEKPDITLKGKTKESVNRKENRLKTKHTQVICEIKQ